MAQDADLRFDNVSTFLDYVDSPCELDVSDRSSMDKGFSNKGTFDMPEALHLARYGWLEGAERVSKLTTELIDRIAGNMPIVETYYDVTGDCLDIGRFVTGEPETFMSLVATDDYTTNPSARFVRFTVNITALGHVGEESMIQRGVAALAAINLLERMNIRCEVDIVKATQPSGNDASRWLEIRIRVKECGEAVELEKLAFMCAHPSVQRRFMFSAQEHLSAELVRVYGFSHASGSYGYSRDVTDQGDIYMPKLVNDWGETDSYRWVVGVLKSQGIKLSA